VPAAGSTLHVTNGDSVAASLRQMSVGGAALSWQDPLHAGPVPSGPRAALLDARAAFLSACGWGRATSIRAGLEARDRELLQALADEREVVLWFEHDLFDQLQLLDVLSLAAGAGAATDGLQLIVVGSFPGRPRFHGLGELTPAELESLWPLRRAPTDELFARAGAAWDAVRAPQPTRVAALERRGIPELPFLSAALERLLEELPGSRDGLSGVERRALRALEAGARSPGAAFAAVQADEPAPFLGDTWFHRTLSILGSGPARLLELADGAPLPQPPPLGSSAGFAGAPVRVTELGRRVLAGEADRVELLGIDRWVGGMHLLPGAVWRWDVQARDLVAPSA
jgi:hypothetical protein